jgi:hypothetical protein
MKNWFSRLLGHLTGDQTRTSLGKDWRGRPIGEGATGTIHPVELAKGAPHITLRLPSFKPSIAGLPKILPDRK